MTATTLCLDAILDRHRGPYVLCVTRLVGRARWTSEWLKGVVDREDVDEEAWSLLDDPRDAIASVAVWSERENQFVTIISKGGCSAHD